MIEELCHAIKELGHPIEESRAATAAVDVPCAAPDNPNPDTLSRRRRSGYQRFCHAEATHARMGAWGTAIFSDDTAADVRDAFTDFVAKGLSPTEATSRLLRESADLLADEDDAVVFWLALAATQWKLGRLLDDVRDRAVAIIDSGDDLRRWEDSSRSAINQRKKHLAKLREQVLSPQAKPKKRKPFPKSSTDFRVGDVAAYWLNERTSVRFCVLHLWGDRGGTYCDISLLGLDDGQPFVKRRLALADTLGPHYTMLSHEPPDRITLLARDVVVPKQEPKSFRAWNNLAVHGHACSWDEFPDALRTVLPKLGWRRVQRSGRVT